MKALFTCVIAFSCFCCTAQKLDYRKMKDTICPPLCGWRDSVTLVEIIPKLLAIDTNQLHRKSLSAYFDDLAMIEYELYAYTLDTSLIRTSAEHSALAAKYNPKLYGAYWNAAFAFGMLQDCEKMNLYLSLYKKKVPRRFIDESDKEQMRALEAKCNP